MMSEYQRILLVSYNALSKENANGRTLEFLLGAYGRDNIAQLYFSSEKPDFSVSNRYYCVDENQLFKAVLKGGSVGAPVSEPKETAQSGTLKKKDLLSYIAAFAKKKKKSSLVKFLRKLLWEKGAKRWKTEVFDKWVEGFSPNVIFTISGNNSCFHKIAVDLADEYGLPLVVYHCEDYCFKDTKHKSLFYKFYIRELKNSVDRLMERASLAIYNSDSIKDLYSKYYRTPSIVAYMSTDMKPREIIPMNEHFTLSYMGNLGLGRYESLCEIAEKLKGISSDARIYVYSASAPEEFLKQIENLPNIKYMGFIDYKKCREIIYKSDLLIHVEGFGEGIVKELKIAFSTKIADSLASGVPFFVYAPRGIASTEYLIEKNAACVVTDIDELGIKLEAMIKDSNMRENYVQNALKTVNENHTFNKTATYIMTKILEVSNIYRSQNGHS